MFNAKKYAYSTNKILLVLGMDKITLVKHILDSYEKIVNQKLIARTNPSLDFKTVNLGHFALLAHNAAEDPIFTYGNEYALKLWEIQFEDFIKMPSRLSAEEDLRTVRAEMLHAVHEKNYFDAYEGTRISSTGKRFKIKNVTVWNVFNESNARIGQAAYFKSVEFLR